MTHLIETLQNLLEITERTWPELGKTVEWIAGYKDALEAAIQAVRMSLRIEKEMVDDARTSQRNECTRAVQGTAKIRGTRQPQRPRTTGSARLGGRWRAYGGRCGSDVSTRRSFRRSTRLFYLVNYRTASSFWEIRSSCKIVPLALRDIG